MTWPSEIMAILLYSLLKYFLSPLYSQFLTGDPLPSTTKP